MFLPAYGAKTTEAARPSGPPPWRRGNQLWMYDRPWHASDGTPEPPKLVVLNITTENFEQVVKKLGLATVEVLRIRDPADNGRRYWLVTDPRIPRDWLRASPPEFFCPQALRTKLLEAHADRFRPPVPGEID